jgi:small-conductance mechanosensitive channel
LGVAGIAVGLAAQDTLANTIVGFTVFYDKPFVVGDWVTVSGQYGKVQDIASAREVLLKAVGNLDNLIPRY